MILSMTGFGDAQLEDDEHLYHLELRSVNNRYFKAAIHLPEDFAFLEPDVERLLRQRLTRGSVTLRLYIRDLSAAAAQNLNTAAIRQYVAQLRSAVAGDAAQIDLATIALLPGVCQPRELTEDERGRALATIQRLLQAALDRLIAMRTTEGRALAEDLGTHCDRIDAHLAAVRARIPLVVEEYRRRLMARVNELIADSNVRLAEEDLLKEVAIYAERSDISEEVSRLSGHLQQFREQLSAAEPTGRKLDFISQEMLREANTIGSKASDAQIARDTIEIKASIDRLKEQVQNAE